MDREASWWLDVLGADFKEQRRECRSLCRFPSLFLATEIAFTAAGEFIIAQGNVVERLDILSVRFRECIVHSESFPSKKVNAVPNVVSEASRPLLICLFGLPWRLRGSWPHAVHGDSEALMLPWGHIDYQPFACNNFTQERRESRN